MSRKEEIMKGAFEAYPKNVSYSTIDEQFHDYNLHYREPWLEGARWADKTMIERACEWLKNYRQETHDGLGYTAGIINDKTIEDFKKAMGYE